jgi:hypothetical protein
MKYHPIDKNILFFAAENNMVDLVNEMIKRGIHPSEKDTDVGLKKFLFSLISIKKYILLLIIKGNNILILAFKSHHYDTVLDLLETL